MAASDSEKEQTATGIPKAEFVDDVEEFMSRSENDNAETVLKRLDEQHNKYKFMEYNLSTKKNRLKAQIPDIKQSLDIVKHLCSKKGSSGDLKTHFQLADNLYVRANIPPSDKVCLWLGANVMLEYTLEDARSLLSKNLAAALKSQESVEHDLGYLRDQTTTVEVNMARVYNWDVKRRQALKPQEGAAQAVPASS